ncbi:MAG: hypothetical protein GKR91_19410 [Pseudomonadales bacterium]|nr:hypothetical protein [Pseudomonadales bacterium]
MSDVKFPYKISSLAALFGMLFFAFLASIAFDSTGERPLIGWFAVAFSSSMAALLLYRFSLSFKNIDDIVVGDNGIRMPKNEYNPKLVDIPFSNITKVSLQKINPIHIFNIEHNEGKAGVTSND